MSTTSEQGDLTGQERPGDGQSLLPGMASPVDRGETSETGATSEGTAEPVGPSVPRQPARREARRREIAMSAEMNGLPPIKVVGVGGGGCNAVNRMIEEEVAGVQFVGINTDAQALARCEAPARIRMGEKLTKGLGVGGDPVKGQRAASSSPSWTHRRGGCSWSQVRPYAHRAPSTTETGCSGSRQPPGPGPWR